VIDPATEGQAVIKSFMTHSIFVAIFIRGGKLTVEHLMRAATRHPTHILQTMRAVPAYKIASQDFLDVPPPLHQSFFMIQLKLAAL